MIGTAQRNASSAKGTIHFQPGATPRVFIRDILQSPEWAAQNLCPWSSLLQKATKCCTCQQAAAIARVLPVELIFGNNQRALHRGLPGFGLSGLNSSFNCFDLAGASAKGRAMAGYAFGSSIRSNSFAKQLLTPSVDIVRIKNA